jgi:hypothetical protein
VNRAANQRRVEDAQAQEFARRWDATANALMLMGGVMVATSQQMEASQPQPAASLSSEWSPGLGGLFARLVMAITCGGVVLLNEAARTELLQ